MGVTIKDVAKLANVAPSTVSRVIADSPRISEETKKRVRKAMEKLGYHPNLNARSLASKSTHSIGLVMPSSADKVFQNPFFPGYGISKGAQEKTYSLYWSTGETPDEIYEDVVNAVQGLCNIGAVPHANPLRREPGKCFKQPTMPVALQTSRKAPAKSATCSFERPNSRERDRSKRMPAPRRSRRRRSKVHVEAQKFESFADDLPNRSACTTPRTLFDGDGIGVMIRRKRSTSPPSWSMLRRARMSETSIEGRRAESPSLPGFANVAGKQTKPPGLTVEHSASVSKSVRRRRIPIKNNCPIFSSKGSRIKSFGDM